MSLVYYLLLAFVAASMLRLIQNAIKAMMVIEFLLLSVDGVIIVRFKC